jgi:hypothetical protein
MEITNENLEKKFNKVYGKLSYIENRLNLIEESVNLGTFDTAILALMIFVVGVGISLVSLGIPNILKNNPPLVVGFLYLFVLIIPIFSSIYGYSISIFEKNARFSRKIIIITILGGLTVFVVGIWLLLLCFWLYESVLGRGAINNIFVYIFVGVVFISSILLTVFRIYKDIKQYFNENFKHIIKRRLNEIKRQKDKKRK